MTVRMATRTALERDCSTLRRVGRMWRKCGDTSHVVIFICFVKLKEGLETQTREFSIRWHSEAPVDVVLGRSAVFLRRLVLHRLLLVFHEMCERFAVQWRSLFALFFVVLQRLPQSWVEGRADRGHRGHLGDRGDGGLLGLCALRLALLEHSGEFRGIHVYVWITSVLYMQCYATCCSWISRVKFVLVYLRSREVCYTTTVMSRFCVPKDNIKRAHSKTLGRSGQYSGESTSRKEIDELRASAIHFACELEDTTVKLKQEKLHVKALEGEIRAMKTQKKQVSINPQSGMLVRLQEELDVVKSKNFQDARRLERLRDEIHGLMANNDALEKLKNQLFESLEKERERNVELKSKLLDYTAHNQHLEGMYYTLKEHAENIEQVCVCSGEFVESEKERNAMLQMALDELQIEYDKKVFSLAEAQTKVHELQNAKAVQLNENFGEVLGKLKMTGVFCPISMKLMFEKSVVAPDGYSYDEDSYTRWYNENKTSPITRQPMRVGTFQNRALMTVIEELKDLMTPGMDFEKPVREDGVTLE